MPIFEFHCNKCGATKDKLVKREDEDAEFDCDVCNEADAKLQRTAAPSSAALRFRGQWYSTTRSY